MQNCAIHCFICIVLWQVDCHVLFQVTGYVFALEVISGQNVRHVFCFFAVCPPLELLPRHCDFIVSKSLVCFCGWLGILLKFFQVFFGSGEFQPKHLRYGGLWQGGCLNVYPLAISCLINALQNS